MKNIHEMSSAAVVIGTLTDGKPILGHMQSIDEDPVQTQQNAVYTAFSKICEGAVNFHFKFK